MGTLLWTLGTLQELCRNSIGTLRELCRNSIGTLWELCGNKGLCIPYFTFIEFWILSLCYIIHCTNTILYNMSYIHCIAPYPHIIQYPCIIHCNAKWTTWANTLLLYSPSASPLTTIMGQSFPRWEQCWEHWSNVFYLINIAYERCYFPQKLLSGSTLLSKRCYDPHFLVVSGIDCISYCGGSSLQE
jgi:hypothetical protein